MYAEHCTQNIVYNNKTEIQTGKFNCNTTIYNVWYLKLMMLCKNKLTHFAIIVIVKNYLSTISIFRGLSSWLMLTETTSSRRITSKWKQQHSSQRAGLYVGSNICQSDFCGWTVDTFTCMLTGRSVKWFIQASWDYNVLWAEINYVQIHMWHPFSRHKWQYLTFKSFLLLVFCSFCLPVQWYFYPSTMGFTMGTTSPLIRPLLGDQEIPEAEQTAVVCVIVL